MEIILNKETKITLNVAEKNTPVTISKTTDGVRVTIGNSTKKWLWELLNSYFVKISNNLKSKFVRK
jgi:hypothetical protein|nr:MAG TPA: hypothetical protein [Caudoviricetes sp.]